MSIQNTQADLGGRQAGREDARTEVETRYTLAGNKLTVYSSNGPRDTRVLDADGIKDALGTVFGLPVEPEWRPLIERAAQPD
jgi:N-hydroxyarylamine O-acetyltransferase